MSLPLYFVIPWVAAALTFFSILVLVVYIARATDDPEGVLATLRDHPDQVLELVESKAGVTIVTRTQQATCPTGGTNLLVRLARYCPNAKPRDTRR